MRQELAEVLVRTGPGTPLGRVMRRYWVPVMLANEIAEPDCPPVRVQLLGERLIAFRDTQGRPGLIDEFCAHRTTSLFFGRNEEGGLRCSYHGWKYDVHGQCVDLPAEPQTACKITIKAYPCIERGGVVWAYMGPPKLKPAPPALEWCTVPDANRYVSRRQQECNYLQAMEGGIDTTHVSFVHRYELERDALHMNAACKKYIKADPNVQFTVQETGSGMTIFGRRKGEDDSWYWRITQWIFPWFTLVPPTGPHPLAGHIWVPMDDENCWTWNINYYPTQALSAEERGEMERGAGIHAPLITGTLRPVANKDNNYLIDRRAQKEKRSFSGVAGFGIQDSSLQESMGPIQDRTRERLVQSDRAIILARRRLHDAAVGPDEKRELPAIDPASHGVRSASVLLPKEENVEAWAKAALVASQHNPLYSL
jgi:phenylpropionate dioxygenase-like ring-hydroxylating dioxygenase large terminal subunit